MRHFLFLLLVIFGTQACYQQGKSTNSDQTTLSPRPEYGTFENYAFVMDGKVIEHQGLVDYPGSKLNKIFPYTIALERREYSGAVYFNTPANPVSPDVYADDPAYFINGKQVSPRNIRSLAPDGYNKIKKSRKDTLIDGTLYKGAIYMDTDEDFFSESIPVSKLIDRYSDLPRNQIIVHWRGPSYHNESDMGMVIGDHFPIYYISPQDPQSVKIDRIQFAEGDRYVVQFVDGRYNKWGVVGGKAGGIKEGQIKVQSIFKDPLAVDTACPCCLTDFDTTNPDIFRRTEIDPKPHQGEGVYRTKLSGSVGLPAGKSTGETTADSITVRFVVTKEGMLAMLESNGPIKPGEEGILAAIKQHSCTWSPGIQSGIPRPVWQKMTVVYSKDHSGNIQSLDTLKFKHDK